jgi:hypothetical protein
MMWLLATDGLLKFRCDAGNRLEFKRHLDYKSIEVRGRLGWIFESGFCPRRVEEVVRHPFSLYLSDCDTGLNRVTQHSGLS